jgi:hypothetical protein
MFHHGTCSIRILTAMSIDPTIAIRVAFGTNLMVVLPTVLSGAIKHHKKGVVLWNQAITLGVIGAIGGFGRLMSHPIFQEPFLRQSLV